MLKPASLIAVSRSALVVILIGSTILILYGSAQLRRSMLTPLYTGFYQAYVGGVDRLSRPGSPFGRGEFGLTGRVEARQRVGDHPFNEVIRNGIAIRDLDGVLGGTVRRYF